jgi:hypothetical protein
MICHQKREGARSNNTLTYCMGLSNIVISELLGQNTTTAHISHSQKLPEYTLPDSRILIKVQTPIEV